jgi:signal transduction histidine kinase
VQEALTNVVRHANASAVSVRIGTEDGDLVIVVEDDGDGQTAPAADQATWGGRGIRGMTERAAALGGQLTAGPRPLNRGGGFAIRARLPLEPR